MTNDEINIAIAEYCGWTKIKEIDYQPDGTDPYIDGPDQMWLGIHPESDSDSDEYESIPDYCNDLNAMHEAEEFIKDKDVEYTNSLFRSVGINRYYYMGSPPEVFPADMQFRVFRANAKERAKAFLKTIDKWKE